MWVEFVVGSRYGSRVFLRVLRFSSPDKNQHSKFQFNQDRGPAWKPAKADVTFSLNIVIYLFIYLFIFCYFTAAMSVSNRRATTWRFNTKLKKFGWNTFPKNARMSNHTDLNLGEVVYIAIIFHIVASWLNLLHIYDFYFDRVTLQISHILFSENAKKRPRVRQQAHTATLLAIYQRIDSE